MSLADEITNLLRTRGAALVGFADLGELPGGVRHHLPHGISFAVALDPAIIRGIAAGPTRAYYDEYDRANRLLSELSSEAAAYLQEQGYQAVSSAATHEGIDWTTNSTVLPHKTVATRAGLGWIGKCALLITPQYGAAVRLNKVLTDAPLPAATPINRSRCGSCHACVDACPGHAPKGILWEHTLAREAFFDAAACREACRQIAKARTGIEDTFCGICIAACPWTRKYIEADTR